MNETKKTAYALHTMGANITAIAGDGKAPRYQWKQDIETRQDYERLKRLPWGGYTAKDGTVVPAAGRVGILHSNAVGQWRCFDIDACKDGDGNKIPVDAAFAHRLLLAMELPADYPWCMRSGSGAGWHVYVRCQDDLPAGLTESTKEKGVFVGIPHIPGDFEHIELRWNGVQSVPSFASVDDVPDEPPALVSSEQVIRAFHAIAQKPAPPAPPAAQPTKPHTNANGAHPYIKRAIEGKLEDACNRLRDATDGQRHRTRLEEGKLVGGLLHYGVISDSEAIEALYNARIPEGDTRKERKAIEDGIAAGKAEPITVEVPAAGPAPRPGPAQPTRAHTPAQGQEQAGGDTDAGGDDTLAAERDAYDRLKIDYNHKNLPCLHEACWDALQKTYGGELYQQQGTLLRINGCVNIVDQTEMLTLLGYAICLLETKSKEGEREKYPDPILIKTMLRKPPQSIPTVGRIVSSPVLVGDEGGYRIIDQAGYDAQSQVYHQQTLDLPAEMSLDQARSLILDDLLGDFPFDTQASRANAVGLLLLPFVRGLIDGATPLHLIEAAKAGTGKGLLAAVCAIIWTGENPTLTSAPARNDDAEWSKTMTAALRRVPEYLVLDNVTTLRSDALAMALTSHVWEGRLLGQSETLVLRNDAVWIATGNNVTLAGDIPRRIVPIRMVATQEDPSLRTGFKHNNLVGWVRANRGKLVRACLTLAHQGLQSNVTSNAPRIGSFEAYSDILGRILAGVGIDGFLGNLDRARENPQIEAWRAVVGTWHAHFGENPTRPGELWKVLAGDDCPLEFRGETQRAQIQSLGHMLRKQEGVVYGGYQIVMTGRSKEKTYALRACSGNDGSGNVATIRECSGNVATNIPGLFTPPESQENFNPGMPGMFAEVSRVRGGKYLPHTCVCVCRGEGGANIPGIPGSSQATPPESPKTDRECCDKHSRTFPDIPGHSRQEAAAARYREEDYRLALLARLVTADTGREERTRLYAQETSELEALVYSALVGEGKGEEARKLADMSSDPTAMHAFVDALLETIETA